MLHAILNVILITILQPFLMKLLSKTLTTNLTYYTSFASSSLINNDYDNWRTYLLPLCISVTRGQFPYILFSGIFKMCEYNPTTLAHCLFCLQS